MDTPTNPTTTPDSGQPATSGVSGKLDGDASRPIRLEFDTYDFIRMMMAVMTRSGIKSLRITKGKGAGYGYAVRAVKGGDIRDAYATRLVFDVTEDGFDLLPQGTK